MSARKQDILLASGQIGVAALALVLVTMTRDHEPFWSWHRFIAILAISSAIGEVFLLNRWFGACIAVAGMAGLVSGKVAANPTSALIAIVLVVVLAATKVALHYLWESERRYQHDAAATPNGDAGSD